MSNTKLFITNIANITNIGQYQWAQERKTEKNNR